MVNDITHSRDQILQSEPVFLDEYLSEVLHLPKDCKIVSKIIIEDKVTDTTRIIRLAITWKASNEKEHKKMFFLKLPIIEKQENAFDKWSMHEIDFYRNVDGSDELPIIKCHDAYIFDDKKRFLLMLDDVSTDYYSAIGIDRNEFVNWLLASESLAKFHSFYWNGANSTELSIISNY